MTNSLPAQSGLAVGNRNPQPAWSSVTVSVANLDEALSLWSGLFGFEALARRDGTDAELASLWNLSATDVRRQALLATPGMKNGMIHLVEFSDPGPAVRDQAEVFDLCPKNLDIYVRDMPSRVSELRAAGLKFRNENYSEVTAPDGTVFREIHLPGHDGINIVLLEVIGKELPFTPQGYAGVGPLITIVADAAIEQAFYQNLMGMELLSNNILEGPEIERMVGLPPGSALDVSIWGNADETMGQMEVIEYRGVKGKDLYPLTTPKHRGILNLSYESPDLATMAEKLSAAGISWVELGEHSTLAASGRFIRFLSPAGLRIEMFQRNTPSP